MRRWFFEKTPLYPSFAVDRLQPGKDSTGDLLLYATAIRHILVRALQIKTVPVALAHPDDIETGIGTVAEMIGAMRKSANAGNLHYFLAFESTAPERPFMLGHELAAAQIETRTVGRFLRRPKPHVRYLETSDGDVAGGMGKFADALLHCALSDYEPDVPCTVQEIPATSTDYYETLGFEYQPGDSALVRVGNATLPYDQLSASYVGDVRDRLAAINGSMFPPTAVLDL